MEDLQNGNSQTHHHQSNPSDPFEPTSCHEDFLEQMLSTLPNCPWPVLSSSSNPNPNSNSYSIKPQDDSDDCHPGSGHPVSFPSFEDLTSKLRHHVNANSSSMAALLQQRLLLSRGVAGDSGLGPLPLSLASADSLDSRLHEMVTDGPSFKTTPPGADGAVFNAFPGPGQTTSQPPFQAGAMPAQNLMPATGQAPPASASSGVSGHAPQRQRVRARRGQATDPHSIAERLRRERIAERMKALQELVPNGNKTDKASMLDEIIDYVKFLQLQVKVLSMSRLGGASAAATRVADEGGRSSNNGNTGAGSSNEGMSITEHEVVKLMEEDMGSAMQYLQGKGLCLMPISLATAISTATCNNRNTGSLNNNNHRHHHSPPPPSNTPPSIGNSNGNVMEVAMDRLHQIFQH